VLCVTQSEIATLRGTIVRLEGEAQVAGDSVQVASTHAERTKGKALRLLSVCRKQERALAAVVVL
jgi:hypothetical protein